MSAKTKLMAWLAVFAMAKATNSFAQTQNVQQEQKYVASVVSNPKLDGEDVFYTGVVKNILGLEEKTLTKISADEEGGTVYRSDNGVVIFLPRNYGVLCAVVRNGKLEYIVSDNVNAISNSSVVDPQYTEMIEYINKRIVKYVLKDSDIYKAILGDNAFIERKIDALNSFNK